MLPEIEGVEIDEAVIISCPKNNFQPTRAKPNCPSCEDFKGIAIMCTEPDEPWHKKYVIRCAHVIERRTHNLDVIEG